MSGRSGLVEARGAYKWAFVLVNLTSQMAAVFAPLAMAALFALGGAEVYTAVVEYVVHGDSAKALKHGIGALEYIFIAPLPVLLTMALIRYVYRFFEGQSTQEEKIAVLEVKALKMGLLAAAAAAAVVGQLLKDDTPDWRFLLAATFAVLVLSGVFLSIDLLLAKLESHKERQH